MPATTTHPPQLAAMLAAAPATSHRITAGELAGHACRPITDREAAVLALPWVAAGHVWIVTPEGWVRAYAAQRIRSSAEAVA